MSLPRVSAGRAARLFPAGLAASLVAFGVYFDHLEPASSPVWRVAQWAVATQDTAGLPFFVVDKAQARIYSFDPQGRPTGDAPVQPAVADDRLAATRTGPSVAYVIERADTARRPP